MLFRFVPRVGSYVEASTDAVVTNDNSKSESNLIGNEFLSETLRYLDHLKARRELSSRGYKNPGVHYPPRNRVKRALRRP